jgi:hypothetical protein
LNTGYRIREVWKRKDLGYSQPTKAMHVHLGPHQTDLGQFQVQVQSRFKTGTAFYFKPFYMGSVVGGGRFGRNMTGN